MKYVDSNIFIHNLIGDKRMGDVAERFLQDVAKGWKIGDAIHLNTMLKNKISIIVTDDRHFEGVDGITRIDLLI
jgi:predicted nucleic acid-binding protein